MLVSIQLNDQLSGVATKIPPHKARMALGGESEDRSVCILANETTERAPHP
jgi:hypothetical protein